MKLLWTLLKWVLVLAIAIPVGIIALGMAFGLLGALMGLAVMVLRLAVVGLVAWGVFRLGAALFGKRNRPPTSPPIRELPRIDPHYEAAMRELDRDLGHSSR